MSYKPAMAIVSILFTITLAATHNVFADCIYCSCNNKLYISSDLAKCQNECKTGLGCFTAICGPVGLVGANPTFFQDFRQKFAFPKLSCYTVSEQPNDQYNCVASAVGAKDRFIDDTEIDGYGNKDGQLTVSDFDAYFGYGGYGVSANCSIQPGKDKIALFAEQTGTPPVIKGGRFHVARQAVAVNQTTGPWFESKEGGFKKIIHHLQDLDGGEYGSLVKCYEK